MIVVVGCGSKKLDHPAPAAELYQGSYFKLRLAYAMTLTEPDNIFILSALWGFLPLSRVVEPYNLKMGERGSIGELELRNQAIALAISHDRCTVLAGSKYVKACKAIWPDLEAPLRGRIGEQMAWLKGQANVALD